MNRTTRNVLIAIVALIVIVLLGYFAWKERAGTVAPNSTATSTGVSINVGTSTSNTSGYTVTPIYATSTPGHPSTQL